MDGLPSSMAAILNHQPGRPTTGKGRNKGRGNPGPPVLYASSKRPSRSAAPVRPPTSGAPFGAEFEPRTSISSSGSGTGMRFSVRIPTGTEPAGSRSRTPDMLLMDDEIAGWGQEGSTPAGLSRRTTPSPDQASSHGRHEQSKRQSAASGKREPSADHCSWHVLRPYPHPPRQEPSDVHLAMSFTPFCICYLHQIWTAIHPTSTLTCLRNAREARHGPGQQLRFPVPIRSCTTTWAC